ncbi:metal ABC transporter permease [Methanogenium organophilum]|uniref:Metal ABC transporter permease n=1 Tax=Methanogenium organophilum TaxID=2199 RepID=A0A9X9S5P4_METOG|nr:metal ABC transporter permease [Methanogenium organophilum]WAI01920.1 metal ABC transporter permease [Methanogenium organophilum]
MIEALGFEFFRNALIAGVLAAIACGVIGSFVVVKRMASLAGGISHAAFGGIGLGYFLGIDPLAGAAAVALGTSAATAWIRMKAHQHLDTLVGAVWATGMAAGILFIYLTPGFAPDLFSYLFGNILLVPRDTLLIMAALTAGICIVVAALYPRLVAVSFDEEYASVMDLHPDWIMVILLLLTGLTVVMLIQIVGIILVIALLTLPAATARLFSNSMKEMIISASLLGILFTTAGIWLSYAFDIPSGATIVMVSACVYFGALPIQHHIRGGNRGESQ